MNKALGSFKFHNGLSTLACLLILGGWTATSEEDDKVRLAHYNLDKNQVAMQGYDPVSYFQEGPVRGKSSIRSEYRGTIYYFANVANKEAFEAAPEKYEPAFGGWCATALLEGTKYKIDPKSYKIVNGHIFLFYKGLLGNALKAWDERAEKEGETSLVKIAGSHWKKILNQ